LEDKQMSTTNSRRKKLGKSLLQIIPLLLLVVCVQLISRQSDDHIMPTRQQNRAEIESANWTPTPFTIMGSTYTSYPLIEESGLTDIQEGLFNGPDGYAYFAGAPARKTGLLPATLGGRSGWSTDVWASNLQGPVSVPGKTDHVQWEWTAKGELQKSERPYPFVYGVVTSADLTRLADRSYDVFEHDEDFWWNPWGRDDYVGTIIIQHGICRSEVFDAGKNSGWTQPLMAKTLGSISFVRYRLFCFRTEQSG
jgi:hypothetical protein